MAYQGSGIPEIDRTHELAYVRFMSCEIWQGTKTNSGYGVFYDRERKRMVLAHRAAWEREHGPIPRRRFVCHRCDTPACVKVEHLFLGTPRENMRDAKKKGRLRSGSNPPRGDGHYKARFTEDEVRRIRERIEGGETQTAIAKEYGVSIRCINAMWLRNSWAHVK